MYTYFWFFFGYNNYGDENEKIKNWKSKKSNNTVTRTIRISGETFDKISDLAEKNELSFNSVVNQIIEFGLKNLEES